MNQTYFIWNLSPWPIFMPFNTFNLMISIINMMMFNIMVMHFKFNMISMLNLIMFITISIL